MARAWGFLVAILALGCHTTRIFAAAEGLMGPEIGDENEVIFVYSYARTSSSQPWALYYLSCAWVRRRTSPFM